MHLNEGQRAALDAVMDGKNVFITGEGGTGKSVCLRAIVSELEKERRSVIVCAPTGVAATGDERPSLSQRALVDGRQAGESGQSPEISPSSKRLIFEGRLSELIVASPEAFEAFYLVKEIADICEAEGIGMSEWLNRFEKQGF